MSKEVLISVSPGETRIAKMEKGRIVALAYERDRGDDEVGVGDVVLGRITSVEPSINLAFVDVGTDRNAVLLAGDAEPFGKQDGERGRPRIERLVTEGQLLVLSVVAEAQGDKGAKLSGKITIPGQNLVFISYRNEVIFSRQISDDAEKARLGAALEDVETGDGGFILRTSAIGVDGDALKSEAADLAATWADIQAKAKAADAPGIVLKEEEGPIRALRDHLAGDIDAVIIDDGETVALAREYASEHLPDLVDRIEHYTDEEPLFEAHQVEPEIDRLKSSRIALKGGGWITMEETEALVAIDVNSGRRRVNGGKEELALDTNIAAVREVAKQVRLRGLGGAFVIDLIQMKDEPNMVKVEDAFEAAMKSDPMPHRMGEISDFGLLEFTRKRANKPLSRQLTERCVPCHGRGTQATAETIGLELIRRAYRATGGGAPILTGHPDVVEWLKTKGADYIKAVEDKLGTSVTLRPDASFDRDQTDLLFGA